MDVQRGGRHILINGLAMVLVGLIWGIFVPNTPYPRLALAAHIQFESSGLLFIVLAVLLLRLEHSVGPRSVLVMIVSAWLTWLMAFSEAANAWWGTSQILSIAASQAGALGAKPWQETVVKATHAASGLALIVGWGLLLAGFVRKGGPAAENS